MPLGHQYAPAGGGRILVNIIVYNGRVSKTIRIFSESSQACSSCGQIFPRKTLGFSSVSISFPELSLFKRLSRSPGETILLRFFLRHTPSPWPASFGERIKLSHFLILASKISAISALLEAGAERRRVADAVQALSANRSWTIAPRADNRVVPTAPLNDSKGSQ